MTRRQPTGQQRQLALPRNCFSPLLLEVLMIAIADNNSLDLLCRREVHNGVLTLGAAKPFLELIAAGTDLRV